MNINHHTFQLNLPASASVYDPFSIFQLFITPRHLEIIATHINEQARLEIINDNFNTDRLYTWKDTTAEEIGAYLGTRLLMGVHPTTGSVRQYWDKSEDEPIFPLSRYISKHRYEQLTRYFKINHLKEQLKDNDWWKKVDPIASDFVRTATAIYRPRSILSIDEELIMAKGRTKYTLQIPSKAAEKGYKIYSLCDHGYLLDFLFSSKTAKISDLEDLKPTTDLYRKDAFNDSERAVLSLIKRI